MVPFLLSFWPAIAAGSIAIPVVIHLINRRRFKIVPWAAMKFLLAAQKQTRKRMRIEQLLLLLCRMLILAFILIAMIAVTGYAEKAWAWLGLSKLVKGNANLPHRVHHIFVLDASLSMNQKAEGEQSAFEAARQLAIKKIQSNPSGHGYSVLILKDSPTWLVGEASQNARKVITALEEARPSHGNASVGAAYSMIATKLNEAKGRFPVQAVYFFTDMQRSQWSAAAPLEGQAEQPGKERSAYLDIQDKAATFFIDCGPSKDAPNLAVKRIEFDLPLPYVTAGMNLTLEASVENFSSENKKDLRAEVLIGKVRQSADDPPPPMQLRAADQASATIAAGRTFTFRFDKVKFPVPGTYAVQVKIADDALPEDNTRTIIITVRDKIPVLLVNGKASADRFERATEYLKLALNPFPAGAEEPGFPLRPEVVTPGQFSDLTEAQLEKYDCIFWCDVGQFGVNDVRKIDGHLRRGGGFVVTLGDKAAENLDRYNDLLFKNEHGLLPAKLLKKITAPADHHFYFQNSDDAAFKEPPLAAFSHDQDRLTLRSAQFRQFVLAAIPEGKANAVLSFMPEMVNAGKAKRDDTLPVNAPAIVVWNPPLARAQQPPAEKGARAERHLVRYRGKVILLTSTVNMDWTSWPGSPSFGAMMHELTRLAVSGRLHEQSQTVGSILETYLPGGAEFDVTVTTPVKGAAPKKIRTQLVDDVNLFRYPRTAAEDTDISGIYNMETNKGFDVAFAVNVPGSSADQKHTESDLARLDEGHLSNMYPGWKLRVVRSPLDVLVTGGVEDAEVLVAQPMGPTIANILLLAVLGFLFAEIVMAWGFGHYTTTQGALTNAPPGPASTSIAAGIAILFTLLFATGLFVYLHFWATGNFLGFLPDLIREWFERQIGVDRLQAGEGSNWNYDPLPWLFGIPGSEFWYSIFLTGAAGVVIFLIYRAEAPRVSVVYKLLLGVLRLFLILGTVWFLLPRPQISYDRVGFPDLVLLIDDTRSMGEPDTFKEPAVIERVKKLSDGIRAKMIAEVPAKIDSLRDQIDAKKAAAAKDPDVKLELDGLTQRLHYWEKQRDDLNANRWRPSRLQLVQAILAQPEPHWLKYLLATKKTKVHIFHLDAQGRATKLRDENGDAGDLIDPNDHRGIERSLDAIARLEPVGDDSRLGTAVKQVIDHYRGSGLSSVIMFTDGVTTRDETLADAGGYAASKGISLFFVGIGDEQELRDLKLHDMNLPDQPYVGDTINIDASLTGKGYRDLTVPVVLSVKTKDGKEFVELKREMVKVDPTGNARKLQFVDTPKVVGKRTYRLTVEPPKLEGNEKPVPPANLRLERTIEVIDIKKINVFYVEGQPRYEFRYLKFLMEREKLDEKKVKSIDLTVLLLDADADWPAKDRKDGKGVDKTAISVFPPTLQDLNKYDVLILGDCDPNHQKIKTRMNDIKSFVRGEDERGKKASKPGGGILFMAGAFHNPHRYKGTPLADVMPIEPLNGVPPPELPREKPLLPQLTQLGLRHPIFRFRPTDEENGRLWQQLTPMYWSSSGFIPKPGATVLAVHPTEDGQVKQPDGQTRQPLVVQHYAGSGRSLFFGFDETWRWRKREDETKFNRFWIETMRYLSRARTTRTELKLEKQVPYDVGEPIKVTVQFPDNAPGDPNQPGPKLNDKTEVEVTVTYLPPGEDGKDNKREGEVHKLRLAKRPDGSGLYEGKWDRTREGNYRFRLTNPDVSATQPDGEKPSADAVVKLPPGELERLRMNAQEMIEAAGRTQGEFFTLANANEVLDKLPPGSTIHVVGNMPPSLLWNQWWVFALVLFLISSEWILRKMKHLL